MPLPGSGKSSGAVAKGNVKMPLVHGHVEPNNPADSSASVKCRENNKESKNHTQPQTYWLTISKLEILSVRKKVKSHLVFSSLLEGELIRAGLLLFLSLKVYRSTCSLRRQKTGVGVGCCPCPPQMINRCGGIFPRPLLGVDGKQAPNGAEKREVLPAITFLAIPGVTETRYLPWRTHVTLLWCLYWFVLCWLWQTASRIIPYSAHFAILLSPSHLQKVQNSSFAQTCNFHHHSASHRKRVSTCRSNGGSVYWSAGSSSHTLVASPPLSAHRWLTRTPHDHQHAHPPYVGQVNVWRFVSI